jgi:hypothetical protein
MAAFCTCCGEAINLKSMACPACGAPSHGMSLRVARHAAGENEVTAPIETARVLDQPVRKCMAVGCCAA